MKTRKEDLKDLTLLGRQVDPTQSTLGLSSKKMEAFPNHDTDRFFLVSLHTDEFTCLCPMTGQPDFATITVKYIPDKLVVESKSYKLYLWSYRNEGAFHEHVVNTILDDLVKLLDPHYCKVIGDFNVRGGIDITVETEFCKTPKAKEILV